MTTSKKTTPLITATGCVAIAVIAGFYEDSLRTGIYTFVGELAIVVVVYAAVLAFREGAATLDADWRPVKRVDDEDVWGDPGIEERPDPWAVALMFALIAVAIFVWVTWL